MPCTRPELNVPGAARAASVNSFTLLYGASFFTATARIVVDTRAIGIRSAGL
jgi:hypothetical protein